MSDRLNYTPCPGCYRSLYERGDTWDTCNCDGQDEEVSDDPLCACPPKNDDWLVVD